jgi:hypothetical protein
VQPVRPQGAVRTAAPTALAADSTSEVLKPAWGSTSSSAAANNRAQRLSVRGSSVSTICTEVSTCSAYLIALTLHCATSKEWLSVIRRNAHRLCMYSSAHLYALHILDFNGI